MTAFHRPLESIYRLPEPLSRGDDPDDVDVELFDTDDLPLECLVVTRRLLSLDRDDWPKFLRTELFAILDSAPIASLHYRRLEWIFLSVLVTSIVQDHMRLSGKTDEEIVSVRPHVCAMTEMEHEFADDLLKRYRDHQSAKKFPVSLDTASHVAREAILTMEPADSSSSSLIKVKAELDRLFRSTVCDRHVTGTFVLDPFGRGADRSAWDLTCSSSTPKEKYVAAMNFLARQYGFVHLRHGHLDSLPRLLARVPFLPTEYDGSDEEKEKREIWLLFAVLGSAIVWERNCRVIERTPEPWIPEMTPEERSRAMELRDELLRSYVTASQQRTRWTQHEGLYHTISASFYESTCNDASDKIKLIGKLVDSYREVQTIVSDERAKLVLISDLLAAAQKMSHLAPVTRQNMQLTDQDISTTVSDAQDLISSTNDTLADAESTLSNCHRTIHGWLNSSKVGLVSTFKYFTDWTWWSRVESWRNEFTLPDVDPDVELEENVRAKVDGDDDDSDSDWGVDSDSDSD